ncbi:MAG: efflux RND transporter permease subunit [Gemmatimonadota bacterium]
MIFRRNDKANGHGGPEPSEQHAHALGGQPDDPERLSRFKEFFLTSVALRHRTSALVLLVIIGVLGLLSYRALPRESNPDITIPFIAVNTIYTGASPSDVEQLVTRVIEEDLNTIADIKELTSTSIEGYSSITAEFDADLDVEDALAQVREKVDLARPDLPDDAEEPAVVEFNLSEQPIMQVNVSGQYGAAQLRNVGEALQDKLEQIPSILEVVLRGDLEREVSVDIDLAKLKAYDVAFQDVIDAIRSENVNIPGGSVDVGPMKYLVRVDGEFDDPAGLSDIVVLERAGQPIYLRDIATVEFDYKERDSYARLDGASVVTLDVIKRTGENIIQTSDAVKIAIDEMLPAFPASTSIKVTSDASEDIHMMVSSLENNIISGLILIVGVLLFFLGMRTSFFVGISIPLSMFLSFILLRAMGQTLNMVVLFSLILALGMLVDNAIVVVENIYRYMEQGWERSVAARKAVGEVAVPVIAATATTVAAFAPLLFWPGIVGEFMGFLPRTLIITLSSSLFVALVIIPVLCALFLRVDAVHDHSPREVRPLRPAARWTLIGAGALFAAIVFLVNPIAAVLLASTVAGLFLLHHAFLKHATRWFQEHALPLLVEWYEDRLRWALDHRVKIVLGTMGVFVVTLVAFRAFSAGVVYFPEDIPPDQIIVQVDAPTGTAAGFTNSVAERLEGRLRDVPGVTVDEESVVSTIGGGGRGGGGQDAGTIRVSLIDYQDREYDAFETMSQLEAALVRGIAGADVTVTKPQNGPSTGGKPISLEIVGPDPEVLERLADDAMALIEASPVAVKLQGLENDLDQSRPELRVEIDRARAGLYGLSTGEVGNAIRMAVQGIEASKFRTPDDEYDIVVRLAEEDRADLESLRNLTVDADGQQIPLTSLATWSVQDGYGAVLRKDLDRVASINSDVAAGQNTNAVLAEVRGVVSDFSADLPAGYSLRFGGQSEDQAEASAFLTTAFFFALALIALILISQFNSVIKPFIILTSVIMSTVGVLVGLMIFRMPFGIIMTGVGVISLAGIVVNNAIILIDYIDILREREGMDRREALVVGGKTRFRPVVLTAITTALGLVPLAIGLNFDFFGLYGSLSPEMYWGGIQAKWWGPMAVAVIVGILFATFLTLVLVPVMYSITDDLADWFRGHYTYADEVDATGTGGSGGQADEEYDRRPAGEREPEAEQVPVLARTQLRPGEA